MHPTPHSEDTDRRIDLTDPLGPDEPTLLPPDYHSPDPDSEVGSVTRSRRGHTVSPLGVDLRQSPGLFSSTTVHRPVSPFNRVFFSTIEVKRLGNQYPVLYGQRTFGLG